MLSISRSPRFTGMVTPSISIIGLGRLGSALKKNLERVGYQVSGFGRADQLKDLGQLIFITTSDSEIEQVVSELVVAGVDKKTIVHCSGLVPVTVLNPLSKKGALTGSFHPNQAITENTQDFGRTVFDIVGGEDVFSMLEKIAKSLNAEVISITEEQKQYLHIAAVMASNYQVTLMHLARKTGEEGGLDSKLVQKTMLPLMKSVLGNLQAFTPAQALTGPIARGDVETLQQHVKLLKNNKSLLNIYAELGKISLEMMISNDRADINQKIRDIFNK